MRIATRLLFTMLVTLALGYGQSEQPPPMRRKPAPSAPAEPAPPPEKPAEKQEEEKEKKTAPPAEPAPPEEADYPRTQRPVKPVADPRDPGAPKLKRGSPAPRPQGPDVPEPDPEPLPPPAPARTTTPPDKPVREVVTDAEGRVEREEGVVLTGPSGDPVIEKARQAAFEFTDKLPNFICDQLTLRSTSQTRTPTWKLKDRVEVELIYVSGKEDYRNVRLNGKALKKGSPEDSGTWSTGEFGTILIDLFATNTQTEFTFKRMAEAVGVQAKVYDFRVLKVNSHWEIRIGRSVKPAYKGSIWVDPATGTTLRIEMSTRQLPADYAVDTVETSIDYGWVRIAGQKYLLPVNSANLTCFTGTFNCTMNEIEFRNYRKFTAESQVLQVESELSFPEVDDPKKPKSKTEPPQITEPAKPPKKKD